MILNKFRPVTSHAIGLVLLVSGLFSCNKTSNSNINRTFLAVTHVAYGVGPVNLSVGGKTLLPGPLSLGQTSGIPGNPYDTATPGIQDLNIFLQQDLSSLLNGNAAFQAGNHFSMFFYDSLTSNRLIIFQDNPIAGTDSSSPIRYLNFSPGTNMGLLLTNAKDTVKIGPGEWIGYNPQPASYGFILVPTGSFGVYAFMDSTYLKAIDSLRIDSAKVYNIFLQGFKDSNLGTDSLKLQSVRLN